VTNASMIVSNIHV